MMKQAEYTCIEPTYLEHFFCDGSKCGGSICCCGWQQILDEEALCRYRSLSGEEGENMRSGLVYLEEARGFGFVHEHDHCVFLCEDGLCSLQKKYGAEMLTDVCAEYPRKTRLFPQSVVERALCVTCPVAAELILQNAEPISLVQRRITSTRRNYFQPAGEAEVLAELNFFDWQSRGMEILQSHNLSLPERLELLLSELAGADAHLPWGSDTNTLFWQSWNVKKQAEFFRAFVAGIEDNTAETGRYLSKALTFEQDGFMTAAEAREVLQENVWQPYGLMLENYLVNEWFKELYPCAVLGSFAYNGLYFVIQWELWQFLLLLDLRDGDKKIPQAIRDTARWLASRLNHYTEARSVLVELLRANKG